MLPHSLYKFEDSQLFSFCFINFSDKIIINSLISHELACSRENFECLHDMKMKCMLSLWTLKDQSSSNQYYLDLLARRIDKKTNFVWKSLNFESRNVIHHHIIVFKVCRAIYIFVYNIYVYFLLMFWREKQKKSAESRPTFLVSLPTSFFQSIRVSQNWSYSTSEASRIKSPCIVIKSWIELKG